MTETANSATNGDSTSLVASGAKKKAKLSFCKSHLMLPFGKSTFYVPEESIVSVPKGVNRVQTAAILNQIINTKSPATWYNYLDPDRLLLIKGNEGTSVYTCFKVMDQTEHEEECFIRHIPPTVCEKMFPKWKEQIAKEVADPEHSRAAPTNERQEARLKVLDWKGKDCQRAQINPENNGWEIAKDPPKSLKAAAAVASGGKRVGGGGRARPAGANGSVDDDIMVSTAVVGGETIKTFKIAVGKDFLAPKLIDGFLYMTTVKATPAVEAATDTMAGATVEDGADGEE